MTTVDKQLTSHVPVHTNHDDEQASSTVYQRKEELKRKAVETDLPTNALLLMLSLGSPLKPVGR